MAVEFEDAAAGLAALERAGIRVGKVQVSAGLRVQMDPGNGRSWTRSGPSPRASTSTRWSSGATAGCPLPRPAGGARGGRAGRGRPREWRIHFHVPLFREELGPFASTQDYLRGVLGLLRRKAHTPHLEVETYTWDVLPEEYRREDIAAAVARELRWVLDQLGAVVRP